MQSFFRFLLILGGIVIVFLGGWFSSDWMKQDPFLASMFNIKTEQYGRFIQDISAAIKESTISEASLGPNMEELLDSRSISDGKTQKAELAEDADEASGSIENIENFDPNNMITTVAKKMTSKEKVTFLLWARAKFNDQKLEKITKLMQNGVNGENLIQLYQLTKEDLKGNDYEYLLSFLDRYLISQQETIPTFQMN